VSDNPNPLRRLDSFDGLWKAIVEKQRAMRVD
jgi:hypothetical protein